MTALNTTHRLRQDKLTRYTVMSAVQTTKCTYGRLNARVAVRPITQALGVGALEAGGFQGKPSNFRSFALLVLGSARP